MNPNEGLRNVTADVPVFVVVVAASNYFAGNRYVLKGDTAVMLLFDSNGKIAGIQNGVRNTSLRMPLLFLVLFISSFLANNAISTQ